MVEYVKDNKGNAAYKEATITIFEENIRRSTGTSGPTVDDMIVSNFTHEGDQDTNQRAINAIKDRQEGKTNNYGVEGPAYAVGARVLKEIQEARAP